ncbi:uncharacterized protein LOC113232698 isoform X1 [Hyposmocoma kahamanoa]|uniref:uncharacterized protein LOC113232698 isoform X1 n=1 Tax=Hyposmocoma kahamanoa TaxID=1477025 RepID=UPI000E6D9C78|nr:uncharacterized protein LOC113232698 isoform X1 [Hyposmocoma kahamanoa]
MPVFSANVSGILKVGDRIEIGGKIKENARKMSVNLCAQEGEEPRDVVLHFDVRFHRDNIISLSRKNGVWIGSGNYDTNYNMFVPGTVFRIIFEIKDTDVITIYCQGKFHSNFLPKIPLSMARYVVAWADVEKVTHCYFHLGSKAVGDDPTATSLPFGPVSPRNTASPTLAGDAKRCSQRVHKKSPSPGSPQTRSSGESSEDDMTAGKARKPEPRTDRFFYDTLMCQSPEPPFSSPDRRNNRSRVVEYARKYNRDSDTEKNETDDYTDEAAKIDSSIAESEDVLTEIKKRGRRGKFGPLAQVVNFMGKNGKRN